MTLSEPISVLSRFAGPHGRHRAISALIEQRPVVGNLAAAEELLNRGEMRLYGKGESLMVEGDWSNEILFLLAGSVEVSLGGFVIVERAAGIPLGEVELTDPSHPRLATITALEPTVALSVSETHFADVATKHPDMWRQICKILAERLFERSRFIRPMNKTPRLFLACSTEALPIAKAFQRRLSSDCLVADIWNGGIFKPAEHAMESLGQQLSKADFALAILSPDDQVESRGQTQRAPRDNTIYELGLFAGALGRARCYYAVQRGVPVKIPSDLTGIMSLRYTLNTNGRTKTDCAEACAWVMERVTALGPR